MTIYHAVSRGAGAECGANPSALAGPGLIGLNCPACWASLKSRPWLDWNAAPVRAVPDGWRLWDGWLQRAHGVWWLADSGQPWIRVAPGALRLMRRQLRRRGGWSARRVHNVARRDKRPMVRVGWGEGVRSATWGYLPARAPGAVER